MHKHWLGTLVWGILEAPHYKLPVVNIGNRQKGRLNAGNVEFVGYQIDEICRSVEKACCDKDYRREVELLKNPYGEGSAAKQVYNAINQVDLDDQKWYIKKKLCP